MINCPLIAWSRWSRWSPYRWYIYPNATFDIEDNIIIKYRLPTLPTSDENPKSFSETLASVKKDYHYPIVVFKNEIDKATSDSLFIIENEHDEVEAILKFS
jgi:hypothetical protein